MSVEAPRAGLRELEKMSFWSIQEEVSSWPFSLKAAALRVAQTAEDDRPILREQVNHKISRLRRKEEEWWQIPYFKEVVRFTRLNSNTLENLRGAIENVGLNSSVVDSASSHR